MYLRLSKKGFAFFDSLRRHATPVACRLLFVHLRVASPPLFGEYKAGEIERRVVYLFIYSG